MSGSAYLWTVIIGLGIGTYLVRFSFLGLLGGRQLPEWALRHLRYAPHAVLPGMLAPGLLWPDGAGLHPDPARLAAVAATVVAGVLTRNGAAAMVSGGVVLGLGLWLVG